MSGDPDTLSQMLGLVAVLIGMVLLNKGIQKYEDRQRKNGTYQEKGWEGGYQK